MIKYQLKYLPSFSKELNVIMKYIKNDLKNTTAAINLVDKIENAILKRLENPLDYEVYPSSRKRKLNYYRIYIKNYIIFYTVHDNIMEVRRILYRKRNFQNLI